MLYSYLNIAIYLNASVRDVRLLNEDHIQVLLCCHILVNPAGISTQGSRVTKPPPRSIVITSASKSPAVSPLSGFQTQIRNPSHITGCEPSRGPISGLPLFLSRKWRRLIVPPRSHSGQFANQQRADTLGRRRVQRE
jgi:hypothetical protein